MKLSTLIYLLIVLSADQLMAQDKESNGKTIDLSTTQAIGENLSQYPENRPSEGSIVGPFHILPYGALWSDVIYATSRTSPGAFTLWVPSSQTEGEPAFTIDVRRTRFGLNIEGPKIPFLAGASSNARVEIDFHGDFVTENRAAVLLRHAYWEVQNNKYRFLIGQNWDVIPPLNPGTLSYSVGWMAGNIGFRRAQIRFDQFFHPTKSVEVAAQVSINQDIVTDFPTNAGVRRESSDWPVIEGRLGLTMTKEAESAEFLKLGFSGHIGETGFDFLTAGPPPQYLPPIDDARFRTWSLNFDFWAVFGNRTGLQGEIFTGANLSMFLGGIGQGVCPCLRVPIRSKGAWVDIWYNWSPDSRSHFGYGLDDPDNNDSLFGRTYNQFLFANISHDVSKHLTTGFEVSAWMTHYQDQRAGQIPDDQLMPVSPGEALIFQWMFKYGF